MNISSSTADGVTTLTVDGRLDTNSCDQLQAAILSEFQKAKNLTLDFAKVSYISSSGLRALLIGQKTAVSKQGEFKLVNCTPFVVGVLNSVGFSKIMSVG